MRKERIKWIDCAKGIAIVLVIVGHTPGLGEITQGIIYSFHMPLFFILSGVTFNLSNDISEFKNNTIKSSRRLLIPAIFIFFVNSILMYKKSAFSMNSLYAFLYMSAGELNVNGIEIYGVGGTWFFFALFIGRTLFDYLHLMFNDKLKLLFFSCLCCILGITMGQLIPLPFSADIALSIIPFFYYGMFLRNANINESVLRKMILSLIVWLISFFVIFPDYSKQVPINLAGRDYGFFPITYFTAFVGTMSLCYFCVILCEHKVISKPFVFIGQNSLVLFAIHSFDDKYIFPRLWVIAGHPFCSVFVRIGVDITVLVFIMISKFYLNKLKRNS